MKLEAGMYARLKRIMFDDVSITKIKDASEAMYYNGLLFEVIKTSYNIIDLVEEGDYVNGSKVESKFNEYVIVGKNVWTDYDWELDEDGEEVKVATLVSEDIIISANAINSVVTKERFRTIEYSLKGE